MLTLHLIQDGFLNSVLIIIIFFVLAWITQYFFGHVVKRFTNRTRTEIDDQISKALQRPVYYSVLLAGLYIALNSTSLNLQLMQTIKNILFTIGFAIWAFAIANVVGLLLDDLKDKLKTDREAKIDSDVVPFIENLVKAGLFGIAVLMTLDLWGIDITPLLASAGVAGVAVAFAARDTVSNLFGGVSVFMDRPYRVGDYVYIDNQYRGEVIEIGMRSTKIKTRDNVLITVPNAVMVTQSVVNETGFDPKMRLRIPLSVNYDSDLDHVEYVLNSVAKEHEEILDEPNPRVRYREFAESGISLELLAYIDYPENRGRITHEIIKMIMASFGKEGIIIPYPHREVLLTHRN